MAEIRDLKIALSERRFPTITTWNRLEGRPRTVSFERALRAEVRDALWMLSRQWQLGETKGDDAGSPFFAKLRMSTSQLSSYQPREHPVQPLDTTVPLEAKVERRPVPLLSGWRTSALELRLAMGRHWLATIAGIGEYRNAFVSRYKVQRPNPSNPADADRLAHEDVWRLFAAVAGRAMDGGALYLHLLEDPSHRAYDGVAGIDPGDKPALDKAAERFVAWFQRL
ncbi:MAG TPA: hypothetical protein VIL21_03400, partial [Solirubrobacterales bacterium]